jgi:hypothetical protein
MATSVLNAVARVYGNMALKPTILTSDGTVVGTTDQTNNAIAIQNALNALDGRCTNVDDANRRFIVSVTDDMHNLVAAIQNQLPNGTTAVIQIVDRLLNRTITIAITGGHAEIISIQVH